MVHDDGAPITPITSSSDRILRAIVVEDDEASRSLLARELAHPRVKIDFASSSVEALRTAVELEPDVILMDMRLPTAGFEAFSRLVKDQGLAARVILMSAASDPGTGRLAIRVGAHAWLQKPFGLTEVRRVFLDALGLPEEARQAGATPVSPVRRLLIVEDEPDVLDMLRQLLAHPHIAIETVADGLDGLAKAWETEPHAVLVDVRIPRMSGFDVFDELRRASFSPRIVLMSGIAHGDIFTLASKLGAYACFRKPFQDPDELRATVLGALRLEKAS